MKNLIYLSIVSVVLALVTGSCSKMNDLHEKYLEKGERIYISKIDTMLVHPGKNRVKLRYLVSDPRVKSIVFSWTPDKDSIIKDIRTISPNDSLEVVIGGGSSSKTIKEGNYTLKITTHDDSGNSSIPYETSMSVYGERYQSTLTNRILSSVEYTSDSGALSLFFSGPLNEDDKGVEISYTDDNRENKTLVLPNSEITSPVSLNNVDVTENISYRTMFLPDSTAIDTFFTEFSDPIEVTEEVNVALGKPVKTSDNYTSTYNGSKAVDGEMLSKKTRWISSTSTEEHWLEIDLENEYAINSIKTFTGSGTVFEDPTVNFFFQAEIEGEWVNVLEITGNSDPKFNASFPMVSTSKVRYLVPAYKNNVVRLYEIEVIATIKY